MGESNNGITKEQTQEFSASAPSLEMFLENKTSEEKFLSELKKLDGADALLKGTMIDAQITYGNYKTSVKGRIDEVKFGLGTQYAQILCTTNDGRAQQLMIGSFFSDDKVYDSGYNLKISVGGLK